jgi:hypothetical protein
MVDRNKLAYLYRKKAKKKSVTKVFLINFCVLMALPALQNRAPEDRGYGILWS